MNDNLPARIDAQVQLSKTMAHSNLLPKQYQSNPANLMWAIQYAEAIGVHPMTAITGIHVIEGKPTASAQLIGGLVRRAGHKLQVRFDRKTMTATARVFRADDPEFMFESVWDMDRARGANLTNKSVWKQYPDAMLKARAITEVARDACPEALFGVIYTAEEMGVDRLDEDGAPLDLTPTTVVTAPVVQEPVVEDIVEAEVVDEPVVVEGRDALKGGLTDADLVEEATPGQIKVIHMHVKSLGLSDEVYRDRLEQLFGVRSSKDLSKSQANELVTMLVKASKKKAEVSFDHYTPEDAE